ncbi:hypothetical protein SNEBB_000990 [Seison nebaliae]|nr:hypothetical protein SNEBB_000990 [Seison nebaliae]
MYRKPKPVRNKIIPYEVFDNHRIKDKRNMSPDDYPRTSKGFEQTLLTVGCRDDRLKSELPKSRQKMYNMIKTGTLKYGQCLKEPDDDFLNTDLNKKLNYQIWAVEETANAPKQKPMRGYFGRKQKDFCTQYLLDIQRKQTLAMELTYEQALRRMQMSEHYLDCDGRLLDEFIKNIDQQSARAIERADEATKLKLDNIAAIKSLNEQISSIKTEIGRMEDTWADYRRCALFLFKTAPKYWRTNQLVRAIKTTVVDSKEEAMLSDMTEYLTDFYDPFGDFDEEVRVKVNTDPIYLSTIESDELLNLDFIHLPPTHPIFAIREIYFKEPIELLDLLRESENTNLMLMERTHSVEEEAEFLNKRADEKTSREEEGVLMYEIEEKYATVKRLQEELQETERKAAHSIFSLEHLYFYNPEYMLIMEELKIWEDKVREIYLAEPVLSAEPDKQKKDTMSILSEMESVVESLFEELEIFPSDKIERAMQHQHFMQNQLVKEERKRMTKENFYKNEQKKLERVSQPQKSIIRTRRVMERSRLKKDKKDRKCEQIWEERKNEEEYNYYFSTEI